MSGVADMEEAAYSPMLGKAVRGGASKNYDVASKFIKSLGRSSSEAAK